MASKQPWESSYPLNPSAPRYPPNPIWQQSSGFGTSQGNYQNLHERPYPGQYGEMPPRPKPAQRLDPRTWTRRTKIIVFGSAAVLLLIIIIVAAVEGVKANAYPDYSPLSYNQVAAYEPSTFFDNFDYWDTYDPADGFVHYDSQGDALSRNLTYSGSQSAVLRVDNSDSEESTNAVTGRHSARVYSKTTWNIGLFLFDIKHSPYGCGTWPAVWLSDQYSWPYNGEIDVIEAVNQATTGNQMTLHTSDGCSMGVKRKESGHQLDTNCLNSTNANSGCGVMGADDTYGETFNSNGGGVYATELRSAGIRIWFFPRASLPADVSNAISTTSTTAPDPSKWGEALADFPSTDCNIGSHFKNQTIIINIDICGTWAGSTKVFDTQDKCPGTCEDYVKTNPSNFDNAYWELGAFKVYQAPGA